MQRMGDRSHRGLVDLLLVVATLATIAAAGVRLLDTQVLTPRRWTQTSGKLIADPAIRRAVSAFAVRHAFAGVDTGLAHALPGAVATVAERELRRAAGSAADSVLSSEGGRSAWRDANREAVSGLLAAVDHPRRGETVALALTPLLDDIVSGVARDPVVRTIPGSSTVLSAAAPDAGRLVILTPGKVRDARTGVRVVRILSWALPLAALALFGLAVALARGWRTIALSRIGYALLIAGGAVLALRAGLQFPLAVAAVRSDADRAAVRAAWLISTVALRSEAIGLLVAGGVLTVASWLARAALER
jgi:hypothetical protein